MDGQDRLQGEHVDIGADESDGCGWYSITFSADPDPGQANQLVTVTANVKDWDDEDVGGVTVHFSVAEGTITEVNETPLQPPATIASGDTDPSSGNATIKITRPDAGKVTVTAQVSNSCGIGDTTRSTDIIFRVKVGFIYDLCYDNTYVAEDVDDFLTNISTQYEWVHYERISIPFTIDPSFNTVFLVLPTRALQTSETASLLAFILSGRDKRIVLVGDYNPYYREFNDYLNPIAANLGIASEFSTGGFVFDGGSPLCTVNLNHYLMDGVVGLWDSYVSPFQTVGPQANSVAWIYGAPNYPWILEEDTEDAGSRILIHDSTIMYPYFGYPSYDDVPDKNFRFVYNLCTIFPE